MIKAVKIAVSSFPNHQSELHSDTARESCDSLLVFTSEKDSYRQKKHQTVCMFLISWLLGQR